MELREVFPDDAGAVRTVTDIENAFVRADCPWEHPHTAFRTEMSMRHGWDGEPDRQFLASVGGVTVGHGALGTSEWDNRDLANLDVAVHPDHRRRGYGTRLLDALATEARAMGRHLLGMSGWESPAGVGFAAATGFELRAQEIKRRMPLDRVDLDDVRAARDEAAGAASAYELVRIVDHVPDDLVEAVADLTGAINDAPTDDLEYEDEVFSVERIRDYERAVREGGWRMYRLVARHRESGELGGHTVVAVDTETPSIGDQHDTSVVRAHRGHRLGLLLKAEMVLWLAQAEPQVTTVDTWNAESNAHMIAVNERLGYEVLGRVLSFQRRDA